MQKFEHSSTDAQGTELIQFTLDDVDQNLSFLDALNTLHGMGDIANTLLGRPRLRGILLETVKTDEL